MKGKVVKCPRRGRGLGRKIVAGLFLCFLVAGVCLYLGQTMAFQEARKELLRLESQRDMLKKKSDLLKEESLLLHDHEYIEMQARKQLGMVRPGEILFFVGE